MPFRPRPETAPLTEIEVCHPDGLIVPFPTPIKGKVANFEIDIDALPGLFNPVIETGANIAFILGKAGFFDHLHYHHKFDMVGHSLEIINGRLPVFVGITDTMPEISVELARYAEKQGAAGLVLIPFYQHDNWERATQITESVLQATQKISIIFYNNDGLQNGKNMPLDWLRGWSYHPRISGIKNSVKINPEIPESVEYFKQVAALQTDSFHVAIGDTASIIPAIQLAQENKVGSYLVPGVVTIQAIIPGLTQAYADIFQPGFDLTQQGPAVTLAATEFPSILSVVDELARLGTINPDTAAIYHALWKK